MDPDFPIPTCQTTLAIIKECVTARVVELKSQPEGDQVAVAKILLITWPVRSVKTY